MNTHSFLTALRFSPRNISWNRIASSNFGLFANAADAPLRLGVVRALTHESIFIACESTGTYDDKRQFIGQRRRLKQS